MLAFAASVFLRPPGEVMLWADMGLYSAPMLIAGVLAMIRGLSGGPLMRPWVLVALALFIYVIGNVLYSLSEQLRLPDVVPSVPDWFWLAFYPVAFVGAVFLTRRRLSVRGSYAWLDALVVGTGFFAVVMAVFNDTIAAHIDADPQTIVLNSLYVVGDFILLSLVAMVIQAFNGRPPMAWWLLLAGFVAFALADATYLIQTADATYVEGAWLDALWPVSGVLFGLGAWLDRDAVAETPNRRRLSFVAPSVALLAAGLVLVLRVEGPIQWVSSSAALLTIVLAVIRLNVDVRQSLALTDRLRRSQVDSLTGLLNRHGILDASYGSGEGCALILLDIDSFKDVNDSMGHEVGDRLLRTAAQRLSDSVRGSDVLARLGGDEFGVLVWDSDAETATHIAESLMTSLERPLVLDGVPLVVTACAGVASSVEDTPDLALLLREAEVALYTAKAEGPGLVRAHDGSIGRRSAARLGLRAEVRSDLASHDEHFVVFYQPITSLSDRRLLAVEGLVRWQHDGRLLLPGAFLPEVIRGGQMADLTRLMLRRSLHEINGLSIDLPVTINVPPELMTDWILHEAEDAIAAEGVDPSRLIVEITEEAIMKNPEEVARVLVALREIGVRTLLDDFGTGWSGLSSLRDLVVDGLKIDGSFVSRITLDATADAIIHGVVALADELGVVVICEGAEEPDVLVALEQFESAYVQGFGAARPMPIDDLGRWFVNHPAGVRDWPDVRRLPPFPAGARRVDAEAVPSSIRVPSSTMR
jgi:diguanylate cyclase (GGDEF)-like protein